MSEPATTTEKGTLVFTRDELREFDRGSRAVAARGYGWIIATIIIFLILAGGGWTIKVLLSDAKGRGDAIVQKNSATNRIGAQERFEDLYAEVKAEANQIGVLAAAANADPSAYNNTNLVGAKTHCLSVVGDYNALARKYTAAQFRAADLPESLSAIDCEGTIQ